MSPGYHVRKLFERDTRLAAGCEQWLSAVKLDSETIVPGANTGEHNKIAVGFEGAAPEGAAPEGAAPEGAVPEGAAREGAAPEGAVPEGAAPEGAALEGAAINISFKIPRKKKLWR